MIRSLALEVMWSAAAQLPLMNEAKRFELALSLQHQAGA